MAELKPCPFCGGEAAVLTKYMMFGNWYQPYCINYKCNTKGENFATKKEAIEAWNKRYEPQEEIDFDYAAEDD